MILLLDHFTYNHFLLLSLLLINNLYYFSLIKPGIFMRKYCFILLGYLERIYREFLKLKEKEETSM